MLTLLVVLAGVYFFMMLAEAIALQVYFRRHR